MGRMRTERIVLYGCTCYREVLSEALDKLRDHHFENTLEKQIWEAIEKLAGEHQDVNLISLLDALGETGAGRELEKLVGDYGTTYFSSSIDCLSAIKSLVKKNKLIQLKKTGENLLKTKANDDVYERAAYGTVELSEVMDKGDNTVFTAKEAVKESLAKLDKIMKTGEKPGIPTGIADYDKIWGGLYPGDSVIIAGESSRGKTALALQIAGYISRSEPVLYISGEMEKSSLINRLVAKHARVNSEKIRKGDLSQSDVSKVIDAYGYVSELKLKIHDKGKLTPNQIERMASNIKISEGLGLVVVDYLQIMSSDEKHGNREAVVASISRGIKQMAQALHVPCIALSQLNRSVSDSGDYQLYHLRESGAIEQDANTVIFVWSDKDQAMQNQDKENPVDAKITIAKQRDGSLGRLDVSFVPAWTEFLCVDNWHMPPVDYKQRAGGDFE